MTALSLRTSVLSWLANIPDPNITRPADTKSRKRRRNCTQEFPTPPLSFGMGDQHGEETDTSQIDTPRPNKKSRRDLDSGAAPPSIPLLAPRFAHESDTSSVSNTTTTTTKSGENTPSRASSPRKRKARLAQLEDDAVVFTDLVYDNMPPPVQAFLKPIYQISHGFPFLAPATVHQIYNMAATRSTLVSHLIPLFQFDRLKRQDNELDDASLPPFSFPRPEVITRIVDMAKRLSNYEHEEAQWNSSVHSAVLACVFPSIAEPGSDDGSGSQLIRHTLCTSARPFTRKSGHTIVDFAIYLDPAALKPVGRARSAQEKIRRLCRNNTLTNTINHTSFVPLAELPICLSIESKRQGEGSDKAELQLGIWLSTQWKFLGQILGGGSNNVEERDGRLLLQQSLSFIPGILVQGHRWFLIISVLAADTRTTIIHRDLEVGSTDTAAGLYKLLFALQWFRKWAEEIYWPWFENNVLGLV
ncbi:hypothetical protein MKZ38_001611 [Zalerion maritima]|uniref:PD-(D/E)XK nuclease-like domain-containing protein n=1 Tax=Zalerion maritima TaxID=339359 RepID=A0AAD5WLK0_9PEZI|nr:hypothetical protein MKZ38_001611 [Zalerion maritima]